MTRFREVVGRHAGYYNWLSRFVQVEEVPVGPYVGRIVSNENGQVADDLQTQLPGPGVQCLPLTGEKELAEGMTGYFGRIRSAGFLKLKGIAIPERSGPGRPWSQAVEILEGHEERKIVEPITIGDAERLKILVQLLEASTVESIECNIQELEFPRYSGPVVDATFREVGAVCQVFGGHQPLLEEEFRADQVDVARERRKTLIRRVG